MPHRKVLWSQNQKCALYSNEPRANPTAPRGKFVEIGAILERHCVKALLAASNIYSRDYEGVGHRQRCSPAPAPLPVPRGFRPSKSTTKIRRWALFDGYLFRSVQVTVN